MIKLEEVISYNEQSVQEYDLARWTVWAWARSALCRNHPASRRSTVTAWPAKWNIESHSVIPLRGKPSRDLLSLIFFFFFRKEYCVTYIQKNVFLQKCPELFIYGA